MQDPGICDRVKRVGLLTLPHTQLYCLRLNIVLLLDCSELKLSSHLSSPNAWKAAPVHLLPWWIQNSHVSISLGLYESSGNKSHEARSRCLFFQQSNYIIRSCPRDEMTEFTCSSKQRETGQPDDEYWTEVYSELPPCSLQTLLWLSSWSVFICI